MFPWRNVGVQIFQNTFLGCLEILEFRGIRRCENRADVADN